MSNIPLINNQPEVKYVSMDSTGKELYTSCIFLFVVNVIKCYSVMNINHLVLVTIKGYLAKHKPNEGDSQKGRIHNLNTILSYNLKSLLRGSGKFFYIYKYLLKWNAEQSTNFKASVNFFMQTIYLQVKIVIVVLQVHFKENFMYAHPCARITVAKPGFAKRGGLS